MGLSGEEGDTISRLSDVSHGAFHCAPKPGKIAGKTRAFYRCTGHQPRHRVPGSETAGIPDCV